MGEASRSIPGSSYNNASPGWQQGTPEVGKAAVEAGKQVTREVKGAASELASQASQEVESRIESQKDRAVEGLGSVADALRSTGQNLHGKDREAISKYMGKAAQRVDRVSGFLREHTIGEAIGEFEKLARREPALFLGGSFVLGLMGGRFLKSSAPRQRGERRDRTSMRGNE